MSEQRQCSEFENLKFQNSVPTENRGLPYPIIRVPEKGVLKVTIQSADFVAHYTHHDDGRGQACLGEGCEMCARKRDRRFLGYMWARPIKTGFIAMLELPPTGLLVLEQIRNEHTTLAGLQLYAWRKNSRKKGGVIIEPRGWADRVDIPDSAPSVEKWCATLWKIDVPRIDPAIADPIGQMDRVDYDRAKDLLSPPKGNRVKWPDQIYDGSTVNGVH